MILIIDSDDDGESLVWECLEQKRTVAVMKAQGGIEKKSIAPTQSVGNRKRNPLNFSLCFDLLSSTIPLSRPVYPRDDLAEIALSLPPPPR